MGGNRVALLPKGTSRKPGKKLLCGVGKRKGSSSWVSLQGSQLKWPLQESAIPLESQNHLLPVAPVGAHKMQPAEDCQHKGCSVMSVTNLKSHQWSEWRAVTPTPTAVWDDQVSRAPADTLENQQLLHCKTNSI